MTDELKVIKIYRAEANFIPVSKLSNSLLEDAENRYQFSFYNEKACKRCPVFEDRHSEACDTCENFHGTRQLSKIVTKGSSDYLSLPIGGTKRMVTLLEKHNLKPKFVDRFQGEELHREIKLTRTLREWQDEALKVCLERKHGIVEAPPRSGKTVLGVGITVAVQGKTFIIASQRDWLEQFRDTYIGSDDEEAFTDIRKKRIGFCKVYSDFLQYDVCLLTFQQFMNDRGRKLLKQIGHLAKLLIIDEVHGTSALETARVLAKFSAEYLIGLTGTPSRKFTDEEIVFRLLVGPIIYKADVEMMVPRIKLLKTDVTINLPGGPQARNRGAFSRFIGKLEQHPTRLEVISKYVARAVKAGHSVMLPVNRMKSVKMYIDGINAYFPENVCCEFTGKLNKDLRKKNLREIRNGDVKVIVGNLALLSTGLNIPRLSMLIERVTITSNLPKVKQRVSRILTPFEGKKPYLVYVLDDCDMQRATARNEYMNMVKKQFTPLMHPEDKEYLYSWFSTKTIRKGGKAKGKVLKGFVFDNRSL